MGAYPFKTINQILDNIPVDNDNQSDSQIITFLDGYLVHNSKMINWDLRFFPIGDNQFRAIRQGGADGVLKFTVMGNGDTKLEILQFGKVI
jgi:hypothetical protein